MNYEQEWSIIQRMRDSKGRFIKGYKPIWSEDSRRKVSESLKGVNTWSRGRKLTEEHKRKVRQNASRYWLGKKRPEMTGSNHPQWKTIKKSPFFRAIRETFKYKEWRKAIKKRDNRTCVLCGATRVYIEVDHHPISFAEIIRESNIATFEQALSCEKLWDTKNGRTLCLECHKQTPTFGKRLS